MRNINDIKQVHQLHAVVGSILMSINSSDSFFLYITDGEEQLISLPVGYADISARFFKHTPPTPDDIEYAINYIEDEIERIVPRIPKQYLLCSTDDFIRQIAVLCGIENMPAMILPRDQLEDLFGQYAEVSMGRPPRKHETDISPQFYAKLLILREFMHHLKFPELKIIA